MLTETHREMLHPSRIEEATAVRPYKSRGSANASPRCHLVVDCGARATTSVVECQACRVPKARYHTARSKYRTGTYAGFSPCSVQESSIPVTCFLVGYVLVSKWLYQRKGEHISESLTRINDIASQTIFSYPLSARMVVAVRQSVVIMLMFMRDKQLLLRRSLYKSLC